MLKHSKVIPILVFDGGPLPGKLEEESRREISRKENLAKAVAHEESGNHSAAYECYQKAVDITPAHALRLIKVLQEEKIDYIVAPYEADAQLAYLVINGLVDAVITEDSDLLAHGCPKVLYKMDKFGNGMQILYADLVKTKELCFTNFTQQMVLEMCIFSGCDYLASLPGMGVKRAHALVKRFKTFRKAIKWLKFQGTDIPPGYEDAFHRAVLTFKHQRVFDPVSQRAVFLTEPYGSDVPDNLDFVGPPLSPETARAIAAGQICPISRTPFEDLKHFEKGTSASKRKRKADVLPERNTMHRYLSVNTSTSAKKPFKQPRTAVAAAPPSAAERPQQPEPEEQVPRTADDLDEWNRLPSASLPESDELDAPTPFQNQKPTANVERRQTANAFEFDLEREAPLASLDFDSDLELDNPFEAFRIKARKSPGRKGPADLFAAFGDDWSTDEALPATRAADSPRRTPLYTSGRLEPRADLQPRPQSGRESENGGLGFGERSGAGGRGFDRRAAALQPVRLPDLNRGAVDRPKVAKKTSSFFKKPAAAAVHLEEPAVVGGVTAGLGRTGDGGNGQGTGEMYAREESPLEDHGVEEENRDRPISRGFGVATTDYRLQGLHDDGQGDDDRQGQGCSKKLEHLEAYSSTATKAMEGLVAKLRTFKYVPSSSRQSALRNPLGNKMRNAFPR
ncbi:DNA repair protein XPGC [Klebsormidium nitens]|uniref:DNA repair protein XPGC n=1 Tax=Klebsormidium nitens TaxID=105231 RepID=A0A1Y1HPQ6_KLENI|nr:DNA repair protein XPGC [Klebsormidium nitens]|eukprot:GAQ80053.1 DNA repair protein XPGC [Klebsormidium nitens]